MRYSSKCKTLMACLHRSRVLLCAHARVCACGCAFACACAWAWAWAWACACTWTCVSTSWSCSSSSSSSSRSKTSLPKCGVHVHRRPQPRTLQQELVPTCPAGTRTAWIGMSLLRAPWKRRQHRCRFHDCFRRSWDHFLALGAVCRDQPHLTETNFSQCKQREEYCQKLRRRQQESPFPLHPLHTRRPSGLDCNVAKPCTELFRSLLANESSSVLKIAPTTPGMRKGYPAPPPNNQKQKTKTKHQQSKSKIH